ncbi:MAG: ABC transporter permease subunit [Flavonifractor plautii]
MGVILNNLIPIIGSSIAMSIPLVLASVGGAFSVRSGIMALGLESMMMMGAFFGVLGSYFTGSVLFGFLLGMVGGMVIGLFHGILSVRYKVNQVISGIGLNLLALAVTTLLMRLIWSNKGSTPRWPPSPPPWTSLPPSPSSAPFWPSSPSASL